MYQESQEAPDYHLLSLLFHLRKRFPSRLISWTRLGDLLYNSDSDLKENPINALYEKCMDTVGYISDFQGCIRGSATIVATSPFVIDNKQYLGVVLTAAHVLKSPLDQSDLFSDRYFSLAQEVSPEAMRYKIKPLSNLTYPANQCPEIDPITFAYVSHPRDIAIAAIEKPADFQAPPLTEAFVLADTLPPPRFQSKGNYVEDFNIRLERFKEEEFTKSQNRITLKKKGPRKLRPYNEDELRKDLKTNNVMVVGFPGGNSDIKPFCPGSPSPEYQRPRPQIVMAPNSKSFCFGKVLLKGKGIFAHSCTAWTGMAGAPIIDIRTGKIVGVLNSGPALPGSYEFYTQLHHWRLEQKFVALKFQKRIERAEDQRDTMLFVKNVFNSLFACYNPVFRSDCHDVNLSSFLQCIKRIPSIVAESAPIYRFQHNLGICSGFPELKLILNRLSPPNHQREPLFQIIRPDEGNLSLYHHKIFQKVLNNLCARSSQIQKIILGAFSLKKKEDPNADSLVERGWLDIFDVTFSQFSRLFSGRRPTSKDEWKLLYELAIEDIEPQMRSKFYNETPESYSENEKAVETQVREEQSFRPAPYSDSPSPRSTARIGQMNLIDMYAIEKMKMEQPSIGVELSPILDSASPRGDDLMSLLKRVSPKYSFKFRPS